MLWYDMHENKNEIRVKSFASSVGGATTEGSGTGSVSSGSKSEGSRGKIRVELPMCSTTTLTNFTWEKTRVLLPFNFSSTSPKFLDFP